MTIAAFIDPPGAFASADEWRAFIKDLEKLPQSEDRDVEIAAAEVHLKGMTDGEEDDDFSDLED